MTTPTTYMNEDGRTLCSRCHEADVEIYTLHASRRLFCCSCDQLAHRSFERLTEQRDFCWSCGHTHADRARRCDDASCSCDAHMSHTRKMVVDAFKHNLPATIIGPDGSAVSVDDAACAGCGCPKFCHTRGQSLGCERCSCGSLIHRLVD